MASGNGEHPSEHILEGLSDSTTIHWTEESVPSIEAQNSRDALTALGYIHGRNRGWTVLLWRQTALGNLSQWFGDGVAPLDRQVYHLGLARQARSAFQALPEAEQDRLRAYSRGLSRALQTKSVRQSAPFVLFDVKPATWAPWHSLLIEQLLAWTATRPITPPDTAPESLSTFRERDLLLRRWLHVHGWNRSVAWAVRPPNDANSARPTLFQRHVTGASATPLIQEVLWRESGSAPKTMATLPGAPLPLTGTSHNYSWASLLHSSARLEQIPVDSSAHRQWYKRIEPTKGDEQLVQVERLHDALPVGVTPADSSLPPVTTADSSLENGEPADTTRSPPDTAWVVQWPGFRAITDIPAWLERAGIANSSPGTSPFALFEADGVHVGADGRWNTLGTPPIVVRDSAQQMLFVGRSLWSRQQARALRDHIQSADSLAVDDWSASDSSAWAADLFPHLRSALQRVRRADSMFQDATTYLRNWDHNYPPSSIGATIFEHWMRAYRADLGHLPTLADTSAYFASYRQQRALQRALDTLQRRLGPDVRRWRWERVVSDRRFFPVWSADSLVEVDEDLRSTRYAPLERLGQGHPSTLGGGPSLLTPRSIAPSPTTWEGWTTRKGSTLTARRHRYDPTALFERSNIQRNRPQPVRLSIEGSTQTTILVPSSQ